MKIALAQMKVSPDLGTNYRESLRWIREAAEKGADLICFPEIQLSPFFPQYPDRNADAYLLRLDHEYIKGICEACREYRVFAAPNLYIEEGEKQYDMSLLIDDLGKIVGKQKMVHIAQLPNFYEQSYYTPSEDGFSVFETRLGKIGIVVCFDRHYPESIRTEALKGADLVIIPTANTIAEPAELFQWEIRVQAFQNSVNIAMCNRTGTEDGMTFSGASIVSNYNGELLALAGSEETLLLSEVDMHGTEMTRKVKAYTSLRRKNLYE